MIMDPYDGAWPIASVPYNIEDPRWAQVRTNLGYARSYADRMNLLAMRPNGELASSSYCLANPVQANAEYLVSLPSGGSVTVNLSASAESLTVEWFLPATDEPSLGRRSWAAHRARSRRRQAQMRCSTSINKFQPRDCCLGCRRGRPAGISSDDALASRPAATDANPYQLWNR